MPHIQTDNQPVTQITVIEPEPGKQAEALSLMTRSHIFYLCHFITQKISTKNPSP